MTLMTKEHWEARKELNKELNKKISETCPKCGGWKSKGAELCQKCEKASVEGFVKRSSIIKSLKEEKGDE